jgi:hypothetical protein
MACISKKAATVLLEVAELWTELCVCVAMCAHMIAAYLYSKYSIAATDAWH